jgi:hypothetical protein
MRNKVIYVILGCCIGIMEFVFGPFRSVYVLATSGSLVETGRRHAYVREMAKCGMIGNWLAVKYILSQYRHSPRYGSFLFLADKEVWRHYDDSDFIEMLGNPTMIIGTAMAWNIKDSVVMTDIVKNDRYLIVEFDNHNFTAIGFQGITPMEDYADNKPYNLRNNYSFQESDSN